MIARSLFALFLTMVAAQAAAEPRQLFDLVCTSATGSTVHFRFDLQQKKWCSGPCASVWFIDELDDALIKISVRSPDHARDWDISINRYTASYSAVHIGWGNAPSDQGNCVAEPFSGFPQKQF